MLRKSILLFIALSSPLFVLAQKNVGVVEGGVYDAKSKVIIPNAKIQLIKDSVVRYSATANTEGNFKIIKVTPGFYILKTEVAEYDVRTIEGFMVKEASVNFVDIDMTKAVKKKRKK